MAHVTIHYTLSDTGRKASLLAGGTGTYRQELLVPREAPEYPQALTQATVKADGSAVLDLTAYRTDCEPRQAPDYQHIPTLGELLDSLPSRQQAKAAEEAQQAAACRAATLAVLTERRTRSATVTCRVERQGALGVVEVDRGGVSGSASYAEPDWPSSADAEVVASAGAAAWLAELAGSKDQARLAAFAQAEEALLAQEAQQRADQAEKERLQRDGLELEVEDGALVEVPEHCWETHKRGSNWLAVFTKDPTAPGGLRRVFQEKAKGKYYYLVGGLQCGNAVEFGADYYSGAGRKNPKRWYGAVMQVTATCLRVRPCKTAATALTAAAAIRATAAAEAEAQATATAVAAG